MLAPFICVTAQQKQSNVLGHMHSRGVGLTEEWVVVSSVGHEVRDKACNLHSNVKATATGCGVDGRVGSSLVSGS